MGTPAEGRTPMSMARVLNMVKNKKGTYVYKYQYTIRYRMNQITAWTMTKLQAGCLLVLKPVLVVLLSIALVAMFIGKIGYISGRSIQRRLVPRLLAWL